MKGYNSKRLNGGREMTPEQTVAFVHAQAACAMADLFGMLAANTESQRQGYVATYAEENFMNLQEKYCIGHNAVITLFRSTL